YRGNQKRNQSQGQGAGCQRVDLEREMGARSQGGNLCLSSCVGGWVFYAAELFRNQRQDRGRDRRRARRGTPGVRRELHGRAFSGLGAEFSQRTELGLEL